MITSDSTKEILIDGKLVTLSKVASKSSVGIKHVYDIEVNAHHNYFVEGISVHNCAYHSVLDFWGKKYNDELYKIKDTFLSYKHRRILCLIGSSLVSTVKGLKPIKDIVVGDKVKTLRGEYANVSAITFSGVKKTYKVVTKDGYSVTGTDNHPMLVLGSDLELHWKTISDLTTSDFLCINYNQGQNDEENVKFEYHLDTKPIYAKLWDYIRSVNEFTTNHLRDHTEFSAYTTLAAVISNLYKNGLLQKKKNHNRNANYGVGWKQLPMYSFRVKSQFRNLTAEQIRDKTGLSTNQHAGYNHTFPTEMTEDLALVLGYMVSEGWFNKAYGFGNTDKRVLNEFKTSFENCFNKKVHYDLTQTAGTRLRQFETEAYANADYYQMRFTDAEKIAEFFDYVGLIRGNAYVKEIPWSILQAPKKFKRAFLQSLFEGDGSCNALVSYTSKSKKLLHQLQVLLLEFGVSSRVTHDVLLILKRPAKYFHKNVGFRFKTYSDESTTTVSSIYEIPFTRTRTKKFKKYDNNFKRGCALHVKHNNKNTIRTTKVNDVDLYNKVKKLSSLGIVFQQVKSITPAGLKKVYDISVDSDEHLFTANGIVVHNCYPAGPNKKTLRGRTRFMSCIGENELVSTNKGLIPIKDVRVNDRINIGNKFASITAHEQTGVKEIWKLKLKCGQELNATPQHKICIYEEGKFKKVKLSDLTLNDQVVYTVGGEFPKNLSLEQFIPNTEFKDERHRLFQAMQELETFDYTSVSDYSKTSRTRASVGVLVSKLVREGYLIKTRKGDYKSGDRFTYSITKKFDIATLVADRNKGCYERRHDIAYPRIMTEELASILGYLVADGCNNGNSLPFKTLIKERRDHYADCVFKVFGMTANLGQYNEMSVAGYEVTNYYANMVYNQWVDYFRAIGLTKAYSADKVVPFTILQSPKNCVIAFLRALFECDALVSTDRGFSYNTTSKNLALQVQQLLFRLGLPNHITKQAQQYKCADKYGNKKIYHYHVCISLSRNDFAKFHKVFGGELTLTKFPLQHEKKNWKVRGDSYRANTKRKNCYTTSISKIVKSKKTTPVYDMTVDCVEHAYQASGILVSNSIDEIGWFDNNKDASKVKMDANEVYVALDRSLLTVRSAANRLIRQGFDDIPNGYAFNVSSPSSARDKIVELVHQAKTSRKIFGFKRATWDMNPNITKDDLSEEFVKDPQAAERDYGCNPPLSDNAFFSSFTAIEDCFSGKPNKIKYSFAQRKAKDGSVTRYAKLTEVAKSTKPNIMAIDAGYSSNSFSMVCGHLHQGLPVITCFCEVIPNPGMPLNHALIVKELMYPVIKERNVKVLISDRWQNIKLLQDAELEFEDLITLAHSLRYDDFWVIKQTMFDAEVLLPKLKRPIEEILKFDQSKYPHCFTDPVEHLAVQLMTVRDMGNSVDKGDSMTDDTFRAMCLAMHGLMDEELFDIFNGEGLEEVKVKGAIGHMIAKTSGGTNKSNEVVNTSSGKPLGIMKSRR